jgi:D-beta-D-heptose 7-phosphate kinase / D-beta-D-heptose 1-phosphate adenosyltransferase
MNNNVFQLMDAFTHANIMVIGEAMLDTYLKGTSERLCREAPVPVVEVSDREDLPGGAANTAANLCSLGAGVKFLSVIGEDPEGGILKHELEARKISTETIIMDKNRKTLAKQRIVADSQMMVRFDQGSTMGIDAEDERRLKAILHVYFHSCDAVIISDYGYGILTPGILQEIKDLQQEDPHMIIVDSKRLEVYASLNPTVVKPNYLEAIKLLGLEKDKTITGRVDQITKNGERVLDITNAQIAAITLDEDGAVIFERGRPDYRTYAKRAPDSKAAGAGDTFISALSLALASGAQTTTAAEIASAAASLVVQKPGTSTCDLDELKAFYYGDEKFVNNAFLLAARLASYHRQGHKIIFTNGCFDILHSGHVSYLNQAKAFGDILIVGINSDESVQRIKGPNRPINALHDRAQVLAALSCVDLIVPFGEDTPKDLIRAIHPDVFVKGGDYTLETLPEAPIVQEMGGEVKILSYMEDHSTTGMIERIRKLDIGMQ